MITEKIQEALEYYHQALRNSSQAKDYLKSRGITKESVLKFYLGYAPAQCRIAPRFHDRIIFPIWDTQGQPIGWTGRTLIGAPAKYLNVRESPVYQKNRVLYPYHLAKQSIALSKKAILVEGQIDVITLHQHGLTCTVGTSGTAFKSAAVNLLSRYADNVYIAFDEDAAGCKARTKAIKLLNDVKVNIRIIKFPHAGVDPAQFIQEYGKEAFKELLRTAEQI